MKGPVTMADEQADCVGLLRAYIGGDHDGVAEGVMAMDRDEARAAALMLVAMASDALVGFCHRSGTDIFDLLDVMATHDWWPKRH